MFVRVKKIKNQKYAYLVENRWLATKKSARQKTTKYLGKVIAIEKTPLFLEEINKKELLSKTLKDACILLLKAELKKCNFSEKGPHILVYRDITVDLKEKTVIKGSKPVSLELNTGFLNNHTLQEILEYTPQTPNSKEIARSLATTLISAGLELEPSFFIELFQSYYGNSD